MMKAKPVKAVLHVKINGRRGEVTRADYVTAKTKQLIEFGYGSLTEAQVNEQIDAVLAKKAFGDGLDVIGMMMQDEILPT